MNKLKYIVRIFHISSTSWGWDAFAPDGKSYIFITHHQTLYTTRKLAMEGWRRYAKKRGTGNYEYI